MLRLFYHVQIKALFKEGLSGKATGGSGFPIILVFGVDKDSPYPYEGPRAASAIEYYALEQLETNVSPPEVTELTGQVVMEDKCGLVLSS
ncbi:hypothetical protein MRB53_031176 [Persea americana]|uniref:Uncharacterized protein n=1 Tax=Persea americana TaxID=3435 RepID=A0ACC2KNF0_PERAE|nr:hypothetical protein MRB53_031176 [Persea americana]